MLSDDAYEFLRALDLNAKEFNFRTIREDGSSAWLNDEHHGSLDSVGYELESRNAHCCVSVQINESSNHSFKGQDITRIRALWVDDDAKEAAALPPLPASLTVETSPGRYHRYWFVEGDWPADENGRMDFDDCMRGMVEKYGCDSQARDIGRLLRLPGTWNRKPGKNHPTKIIFKSDARYTRATLVSAFAVSEPEPQKIIREILEDKAVDIADVQYRLSLKDADDRDTWLRTGMALKHELGEDGYDLWCEWSMTSAKFDEKEQRRQWESFSNDHPNPVTIASLLSKPEIAVAVPSERSITKVDVPRRESDLTERTMAGLRVTFEGRNHHPSEQLMEGLQEAALTIQGMADGSLSDQNFYISFLAPGIGKTSTVIEAVRNLTRMPEYDNVGVIIFLSRLEEIRKLVEEMALDSDEFSVLCAEGRDEYQLGNEHKQQARVMFTTQQMLEKKCRGSSFEPCDFFHWNGRPRQVRIWDEAILPARPLTVQDYDLFELFKPIAKNHSREIADQVLAFANELKEKQDKSFIEVPDFIATSNALETMINWFEEGSEAAANMEALWKLSGRLVRIRKEMGAAVLDYEDVLPNDLGPLLILDASGNTREVYPLWAKNRHGLNFLLSPEKRFDGLTINIWNKGSGHNSRKRDTELFVQAFSNAVVSLPRDESILACTHKVKNKKHDPDFKKEISERCDQRPNLHFVTYGNHTATNDYKDCKHVMLVGVLNYSMAQNEAIGRGAMGIQMEDEFSDTDYHAIRLGEISHNIYQAACRGMVRLSEGDHCPLGTTLWIACPTRGPHAVPRYVLERLFPGATIVDWDPCPKKPKGHVKRLIDLEMSADGRLMTDKQKAEKLGIALPNLYRLRKHPDYAGARKGITTTRRLIFG